jgi:hypothetical protein
MFLREILMLVGYLLSAFIDLKICISIVLFIFSQKSDSCICWKAQASCHHWRAAKACEADGNESGQEAIEFE